MLTRRTVLISAGASCMGASTLRVALAQQHLDDAFPPIPSDLEHYADQPDFAGTALEVQQLGTAHPTPHEIQVSQRILSLSPHGTHRPIDVAKFFEGVGQGKLNAALGEDVRAYAAGWPQRYNPIVINFFKATRTQPLAIAGDGTSWCAAFVNWCIARSLSATAQVAIDGDGLMSPFPQAVLKGSNSASSGSFRCWSKDDSAAPQTGDVIVWAQEGTVAGCAPGPGHVGFYIGTTADGRLITLGGNQRDPHTKHHAIVQKVIPRTFSNSEGTNRLHSIRAVQL